MTKRRITLVVDDTERQIRQCSDWLAAIDGMVGTTVESVEDIPEPIRQKFMVCVESEPELGRLSAGSFEYEMHGFSVRKVSAVEIEAT